MEKTLRILCPERWEEEWERSSNAVYDRQIAPERSLSAMLGRVAGYLGYKDITEVRIGSDFCKHCFTFGAYHEDGSLWMNGGIIFHGLPETGYEENGSVEMSRNYGWSTHT